MKVVLIALVFILIMVSFPGCTVITGESIGEPKGTEIPIESYRFSLTGSTDGEITLTNKVEFVAPHLYHVTETNEAGTWEIIMLGDQRYFKGEVDFSTLIRPAGIYQEDITRETTWKWLNRMADTEVLPDEDIEGVRCRHYRGLYDYEKAIHARYESDFVRGGRPPSEEEIQKEIEMYREHVGERYIELWVGKYDYLVRQVLIENVEPTEGTVTHRSLYILTNRLL